MDHLHIWLPGTKVLSTSIGTNPAAFVYTTRSIIKHHRGLLVNRSYRATGIVCLFVLAMAAPSFALRHVVHHRYHRATRRARIRHIVWHPMFAGSHEMLVSENVKLDALELPRIEDDDQLELLEDSEDLVPIEESRSLKIAANLAPNRRYCRAWTRDFAEDFGQAFYAEFHKPIQINSAVRTVEQQKKLRRTNHNAAPQEGDTASTHLTGVTLDISKRGLTRKQHEWINQYFLPLRNAGMIDPIEERRQPVFHVVVFEGYTDWKDNGQDEGSSAETDSN